MTYSDSAIFLLKTESINNVYVKNSLDGKVTPVLLLQAS
jgi:hypothetical protein